MANAVRVELMNNLIDNGMDLSRFNDAYTEAGGSDMPTPSDPTKLGEGNTEEERAGQRKAYLEQEDLEGMRLPFMPASSLAEGEDKMALLVHQTLNNTGPGLFSKTWDWLVWGDEQADLFRTFSRSGYPDISGAQKALKQAGWPIGRPRSPMTGEPYHPDIPNLLRQLPEFLEELNQPIPRPGGGGVKDMFEPPQGLPPGFLPSGEEGREMVKEPFSLLDPSDRSEFITQLRLKYAEEGIYGLGSGNERSVPGISGTWSAKFPPQFLEDHGIRLDRHLLRGAVDNSAIVTSMLQDSNSIWSAVPNEFGQPQVISMNDPKFGFVNNLIFNPDIPELADLRYAIQDWGINHKILNQQVATFLPNMLLYWAINPDNPDLILHEEFESSLHHHWFAHPVPSPCSNHPALLAGLSPLLERRASLLCIPKRSSQRFCIV